jgi:hypothetical protein
MPDGLNRGQPKARAVCGRLGEATLPKLHSRPGRARLAHEEVQLRSG